MKRTITEAGLSRRAGLTLVAALAAPALARAQGATTGADWPNQPVRYINPYPPGGSTDTLSRLYCQKMRPRRRGISSASKYPGPIGRKSAPPTPVCVPTT